MAKQTRWPPSVAAPGAPLTTCKASCVIASSALSTLFQLSYAVAEIKGAVAGQRTGKILVVPA